MESNDASLVPNTLVSRRPSPSIHIAQKAGVPSGGTAEVSRESGLAYQWLMRDFDPLPLHRLFPVRSVHFRRAACGIGRISSAYIAGR